MRSADGTYRVERVVYSGDNGFRIVKAENTHTREIVGLKGTLHDVVRGCILEITGRWAHSDKFGEQIIVDTCKSSPPEDKDGAAVYLEGCPKVSPALARRIVADLGPDLWRAVEVCSESLQSVRGVGRVLAEAISEWYRVNRDERETWTALAGWGLGKRQVKEAIRELGPRARLAGKRVEELVRDNPWVLAEEVDGVGMQTADEIAARLRRDPNCVERARAGILVVTLQADNREGHCWSDRAELVARTARSLPIERHLVTEALSLLAAPECARVVLEGERVWRTPVLAAEKRIAESIACRIAGPAADVVVTGEGVAAAIEENLVDETLDDELCPF